MEGIAELLSTDGYIIVNKKLIKLFGLHSALVLGELCGEYTHWKNEGKLVEDSFYSTRNNIEENTGLNDYQQRKALSHLIELDIISVVKRGIPAVNYYTISFDKLLNCLSTSSLNFKHLDVKSLKLNNNKQTIINNTVSISKDIDTANSAGPNVSSFKLSPKQIPTKHNLYSSCINLIDDFVFRNKCLTVRQLLIDHLDIMCESKKLRGKKQYEGILKKLQEIGNYENVIRNSIEHGYATFYTINDYKTKGFQEVTSNKEGYVERYSIEDDIKAKQFKEKLRKEGKLDEF